MPEAVSSSPLPFKKDDSFSEAKMYRQMVKEFLSQADMGGDDAFLQPKFYGKIMGKKVEDILAELKAGVEIPVKKTEKALQKLDNKVAALSSYQSSIQGLISSLSALNGQGIGASPSGAFASRTLNLVSGNINNIGATATNDAPLGDIQILIKQIASKDDSSAIAGVADPNAALGWTGSFVVGSGSTTATINMTANMSMNDIFDAVNNQTGTIGITAALTTFPASKVLSFQATNFAAPIVVNTANLVVPGGSTYDASVLPPTSTKTVQNLSAQVQFRNIDQDIYYPSNEIPAGAQVPGVSFTLKIADPNTTHVLTVQNDVDTATEAVKTFVASYNSLQDYLATDEAYKGDVRDTIRLTMEQLFGNASGIGAGQLSNLALVGVRPVGGRLTIDDVTFTTNMNTKFAEVTNVFGYSITSSSSTFIPASRPKTTNADMLATGVQVTVNKAADGTLSATMTLAGQTVAATLGTASGSTVTIQGPTSSDPNAPLPFDGLNVVFNGLLSMPDGVASSATTQLSFTSGVTDQVVTILNNYLDPDPNKGLFSRALQDMVGDKKDKNIIGEKQRLENLKTRQEEAAMAKLKKIEMQFERAQQVSMKAEALKHTVEVYTKMSAAAA